MNTKTAVIIALLVLFFGGAFGTAPNLFPHAQNLGWGPSGGLGALAVILLLLWLFGVI